MNSSKEIDSTSTYSPTQQILFKSVKLFVDGEMHVHMDRRTDIETGSIKSTQTRRNRPNKRELRGSLPSYAVWPGDRWPVQPANNLQANYRKW